mgnify:FL=1
MWGKYDKDWIMEFVYILLRNKPIRRLGTTPMSRVCIPVYTAVMSHRPSGAAFADEKPGNGSRDGEPRKPSKRVLESLRGTYRFK